MASSHHDERICHMVVNVIIVHVIVHVYGKVSAHGSMRGLVCTWALSSAPPVIDLSRRLRWRTPCPDLTLASNSPRFIVSFLLPSLYFYNTFSFVRSFSLALFLPFLSVLLHLFISVCYSSFTCFTFFLPFFICILFSHFLPIFLSVFQPSFPHSILLSAVLHIVISFRLLLFSFCFIRFHLSLFPSFHRNPASLSELPNPGSLIPINMISPLPAGTMTAEDVLTYMHSLSFIQTWNYQLKGGFRPVTLFSWFSFLVHFTKTTHLALHWLPTVASTNRWGRLAYPLSPVQSTRSPSKKPRAKCVLKQPGKAPELASKQSPPNSRCSTCAYGFNICVFRYYLKRLGVIAGRISAFL